MNRPTIKNLPDLELPAPNTAKIYMPGGLTLFYSYTTCVGFIHKGERVFTSETYSNTTARHMSSVFRSNKEDRVPQEEFVTKLEAALAEIVQDNE